MVLLILDNITELPLLSLLKSCFNLFNIISTSLATKDIAESGTAAPAGHNCWNFKILTKFKRELVKSNKSFLNISPLTRGSVASLLPNFM